MCHSPHPGKRGLPHSVAQHLSRLAKEPRLRPGSTSCQGGQQTRRPESQWLGAWGGWRWPTGEQGAGGGRGTGERGGGGSRSGLPGH